MTTPSNDNARLRVIAIHPVLTMVQSAADPAVLEHNVSLYALCDDYSLWLHDQYGWQEMSTPVRPRDVKAADDATGDPPPPAAA